MTSLLLRQRWCHARPSPGTLPRLHRSHLRPAHPGRAPAPALQHPIGPYVLDLAYPAIRLAIEYDGEAHRVQQRAMRDLDRQAYLSDAGWKVLRFTAAQLMRRPWWVAARVREEVVRAAQRHGVALAALR